MHAYVCKCLRLQASVSARTHTRARARMQNICKQNSRVRALSQTGAAGLLPPPQTVEI